LKSVEQIHQDLPLFRITVPTPFPVGPVNLYAIREPEPVLFDTGPAMPGAVERLAKLLGECGIEAAALRKIVLTHFHIDHVGIAVPLAERSGAAIYAHPVETAQLCADHALAAFFTGIMDEAGVSDDFRRLQHWQFEQIRTMGTPLKEFRPVTELATLPCGPAVLRLLHTPGHTPGSVSFWEPERRILLAADTVIEKITPNPFLAPDPAGLHGRFPSLRAYLETLERIRGLRPAVIHGGHNRPVTDYEEHYAWSLRLHRQRQEAVRSCLRHKPHTAMEVAACLFPDEARHGSFLALSEVFAHLDLLEEQGEVRREMRGPVAIYCLLAHEP
jgi:glyoxylase-like metal-dependent hydrolase (beta-lactamase superfamily II)